MICAALWSLEEAPAFQDVEAPTKSVILFLYFVTQLVLQLLTGASDKSSKQEEGAM